MYISGANTHTGGLKGAKGYVSNEGAISEQMRLKHIKEMRDREERERAKQQLEVKKREHERNKIDIQHREVEIRRLQSEMTRAESEVQEEEHVCKEHEEKVNRIKAETHKL